MVSGVALGIRGLVRAYKGRIRPNLTTGRPKQELTSVVIWRRQVGLIQPLCSFGIAECLSRPKKAHRQALGGLGDEVKVPIQRKAIGAMRQLSPHWPTCDAGRRLEVRHIRGEWMCLVQQKRQ